ncbi:hypothetical protein DVH24_039534 [Malus domestica]|uniref:Uncharacterized protein n=1 Tax=Malus domestica TaxID=3750 RepID=A0A498I8Z8_MALDO|nr:hypothetical protein DVH24_039534 [Malus domestica]
MHKWISDATIILCSGKGAFGTQTGRDGTGRNGTGRDGTGRNEGVIFEKDMGYICLKMVKYCVPQTWNKPVPGGRWNAKTPKICPMEQPVPPIFGAPNAGRNASSRSVPSRPTYQTHP